MSRAWSFVVVLALVAPSVHAARQNATRVPKPAGMVAPAPAAALPQREGTAALRQATPIYSGISVADLVRSEATPQSGWVHYYFYVGPGSTSLSIDLTGLTGDAGDIWKRRA